MAGVSRLRKNIAGFSLIGAPALLFVGTVIHPGLRQSPHAQLELIARNPDQWYLNHLLGLAAMVLFVPAIAGAVHLLRDREPVWGYLGGALGIVGVIGFVGVITIFGFVGWQMAITGDQEQMAELFRRINHTARVAIPFRIMPFAFVLGMVCLAIGLYRARIAGLPCIAVAAGPVLFGIGTQAELVGLMIPASGMMMMGLGSVGIRVLRGPEEDWESPSQYGHQHR